MRRSRQLCRRPCRGLQRASATSTNTAACSVADAGKYAPTSRPLLEPSLRQRRLTACCEASLRSIRRGRRGTSPPGSRTAGRRCVRASPPRHGGRHGRGRACRRRVVHRRGHDPGDDRCTPTGSPWPGGGSSARTGRAGPAGRAGGPPHAVPSGAAGTPGTRCRSEPRSLGLPAAGHRAGAVMHCALSGNDAFPAGRDTRCMDAATFGQGTGHLRQPRRDSPSSQVTVAAATSRWTTASSFREVSNPCDVFC
jgi:hypothetical protein